MTFINKILDKLFPQKGNSEQIVHNEVIARSGSYMKRYHEWTDSEADRVYEEIITGYEEKLLECENSKVRVHLLVSRYSNGIAISYDDSHFTKNGFSYLFDHLAEKIKTLEHYRQVNSDYVIKEKNNVLETKEKYYFKPVFSGSESKTDQQYGNILIEHILINDKPSYIKLMANIYSDSNYSEALNFNELIKKILK